MSFLNLTDKYVVIFGLANKKSIACAIGRLLLEEGAKVIHVVRSPARRETAVSLFPGCPVFVCDVEDEAAIVRVAAEIGAEIGAEGGGRIHGLVHSVAYANYSQGMQPFHATLKKDFLQAVDISCFSLMAISNHFQGLLDA